MNFIMCRMLSQARLLIPSNYCKSKAPLTYLINTHETLRSSTCQVNKPVREHLRVTYNSNRFYGFRNFCAAANDLSTKKCVSCSSKDLRPMTEEAAMKLIPEVQGWNLVNEEGTLKLNRSWKVKNFTKGLELFKLVANIAEAENHHPDLHLTGWNNVKIDIWTHSVSGLTENDFILASKINTLDMQHLLRRKMKAVSNKAEE
ncbi:hypothetical protein MKW92_034459 [Papaver armeniacum]|nr:hypothetical protein MKW92_034459 [Papaver armeniacum]